MPPPAARPPAIESETLELIEPRAAKEAFQKRIGDRADLRRLHEEAKSRGYTPSDDEDEAFGIRVRVQATKDVQPPSPSAAGGAVKNVEIELVGVSASKSGAEGAVATCVVKAGNNEQVYDFLLEAPGGDFARAREFTVRDGDVIAAQSWWSAWVGCLQRSCLSTCLSSLVACSGTWAAYFWCVAAACGGCVLRCAGCATCDCSWWCRWAAGCCDA